MPIMVERLRGRAGQEQRRRRLLAEPLCRMCAERGSTTPATVPDHIVPLAKGGTDDDANIRCLCADHHRDVTAEQFNRRAPTPIGSDGRPTDPAHPWNRACAQAG